MSEYYDYYRRAPIEGERRVEPAWKDWVAGICILGFMATIIILSLAS